VVKATVTSLVQKTHRIRRVPPQDCEVIQLARITGSDPVHARSNRALAAKFEKWSQSLAAGCLTVYQEGRVQLPLRPATGVMTRWEGRSSPKRVQAGSNPVTPASLKGEHGIAAGASGLQPWVPEKEASSSLSLLAP
jgi:hypothetical protein